MTIVVVLLAAVVGLPRTGGGQEESADELLRQAAETMGDVSSFHFVLTNEIGTTVLADSIELIGAEGDVQRPDRFRAVVEAQLGVVPIEVSVVGIGDRAWFTNPLSGGEYQEIQLPEAARALLDPTPILLAAVTLVENASITGDESLEGVDTTLIEGTVDLAQLSTPVPNLMPGDALPAQIWLDDQGRVVRLRLEGAITQEEDPTVVRVIDLSRFDQPVEIEAPSA
jgi:hypothetical protein